MIDVDVAVDYLPGVGACDLDAVDCCCCVGHAGWWVVGFGAVLWVILGLRRCVQAVHVVVMVGLNAE